MAGFPYLSLSDPEGYQAALIEVMQGYPTWAGEYAIKRENSDNPNLPISDIALRKALEATVIPHRRGHEWNRGALEQLDDRKLIESSPKPKPTYEEFKEDMARRGMPIDAKRYVNIDEEVSAFKRTHNLTDAQWDAIPNSDVSAKRLDQIVKNLVLRR